MQQRENGKLYLCGTLKGDTEEIEDKVTSSTVHLPEMMGNLSKKVWTYEIFLQFISNHQKYHMSCRIIRKYRWQQKHNTLMMWWNPEIPSSFISPMTYFETLQNNDVSIATYYHDRATSPF